MKVAVLLFDEFETLDVFGPVEIFGRLREFYQVSFYSLEGGLIHNSHGISIVTASLAELTGSVDIFLIPGGHGTRREVENLVLLDRLRQVCNSTKFILTVCTGSALLARTGLLDGKKATSNKRAFDWVILQSDKVNWIKKARWTQDGKYYTAAGVSAGMDMVLGFLKDRHGIDFARETALHIEYNWQEDPEGDNFYTS